MMLELEENKGSAVVKSILSSGQWKLADEFIVQ